MKKAKLKKVNDETIKTIGDEYSFKNMLITTIIIVVVFFAFYFITTLVVKPNKNESSNFADVEESKIAMNKLLDKSGEYYVLAFKGNTKSSTTLTSVNYLELYKKYLNDYNKMDSALNVYMINLDEAINKPYLSDELIISDNIDELKVNDEVLFKIKDHKIENYYTGNTQILSELMEMTKDSQ